MELLRNNKPEVSKECAVLKSRTLSLVDEGYVCRVYWNKPELFLARLKHRHNGSEIVISGVPCQNYFSQTRNGQKVIDKQPIL